MKKLMFAAALATVCGAVQADAISSDIVGYQQYPLVQGYNLYSPVFKGIDKALSLQDLQIQGDAVTGGGLNFICLLDSDGIFQGTYGWWLPEDGTGEETGCWFDGDNWEVIEGTVTEGEGFYVYAEDADLSIQSSGAVQLTQYSRALSQGYNLVGNCSPVDLDVQKITLEGESITGGGLNFICLLDNDGIFQGTIGWWLPEDGTGEESGCWFDGDNWETVSATIKAGEGLYLYAEDSGLTVKLPSAL